MSQSKSRLTYSQRRALPLAAQNTICVNEDLAFAFQATAALWIEKFAQYADLVGELQAGLLWCRLNDTSLAGLMRFCTQSQALKVRASLVECGFLLHIPPDHYALDLAAIGDAVQRAVENGERNILSERSRVQARAGAPAPTAAPAYTHAAAAAGAGSDSTDSCESVQSTTRERDSQTSFDKKDSLSPVTVESPPARPPESPPVSVPTGADPLPYLALVDHYGEERVKACWPRVRKELLADPRRATAYLTTLLQNTPDAPPKPPPAAKPPKPPVAAPQQTPKPKTEEEIAQYQAGAAYARELLEKPKRRDGGATMEIGAVAARLGAAAEEDDLGDVCLDIQAPEFA